MGTLEKASAFARPLTQILWLNERVRLSLHPPELEVHPMMLACHEAAEPPPPKIIIYI